MLFRRLSKPNRRVFFVAAIWCFLFLPPGIRALAQSPKAFPCANFAQKKMELVHLARQPEGLHKAALANGGHYEIISSGVPWNRADSLEELVAGSSVVFIGVVRSATAALVDAGRGIATSYVLRPEETLKGDLQQEQAVVLRLPGGRINFADGSIAVVKDETGPALQKDNRYVIFAAWSRGELKSTSTEQGIFELEEDGKTIRTYVSEENADSFLTSNCMSQQDFLRQLRRIAKQSR